MSGTFPDHRIELHRRLDSSSIRLQFLPGIHVAELLRRDVQKEEIRLVPPDDHIAAMVLPQLQQLRKQPGGEEAGIAPDAAVAQATIFSGRWCPGR